MDIMINHIMIDQLIDDVLALRVNWPIEPLIMSRGAMRSGSGATLVTKNARWLSYANARGRPSARDRNRGGAGNERFRSPQ